jgi:hypothetical protein
MKSTPSGLKFLMSQYEKMAHIQKEELILRLQGKSKDVEKGAKIGVFMRMVRELLTEKLL